MVVGVAHSVVYGFVPLKVTIQRITYVVNTPTNHMILLQPVSAAQLNHHLQTAKMFDDVPIENGENALALSSTATFHQSL